MSAFLLMHHQIHKGAPIGLHTARVRFSVGGQNLLTETKINTIKTFGTGHRRRWRLWTKRS